MWLLVGCWDSLADESKNYPNVPRILRWIPAAILHISGLGTGTKHVGLHTPWLGYSNNNNSIIIIKNEKIRVTLCKNAAGALFIVNKTCVGGQRKVMINNNKSAVAEIPCAALYYYEQQAAGQPPGRAYGLELVKKLKQFHCFFNTLSCLMPPMRGPSYVPCLVSVN